MQTATTTETIFDPEPIAVAQLWDRLKVDLTDWAAGFGSPGLIFHVHHVEAPARDPEALTVDAEFREVRRGHRLPVNLAIDPEPADAGKVKVRFTVPDWPDHLPQEPVEAAEDLPAEAVWSLGYDAAFFRRQVQVLRPYLEAVAAPAPAAERATIAGARPVARNFGERVRSALPGWPALALGGAAVAAAVAAAALLA